MGDEEREDQQEQPERLFDLVEAEQLLPQLKGWLKKVQKRKQQAERIEKEFAKVQNRILVYGGIVPPYAYLAEKRKERDAAVRAIRSTLEELEKTGCLLKDLDKGLVDFRTVLDNHEVYLCWKLGEDRIRYWHHVDEGFKGRKPLNPSNLGPLDESKPN